MNWLLSLLGRPTATPVPSTPRYVCDEVHLPACRCFAKDEPCTGCWVSCQCLEHDDFRRARVRYWSDLHLERMYDRHCARQERSRRLMNSVDATLYDPEIAHATSVNPEIAIVTLVCEVA